MATICCKHPPDSFCYFCGYYIGPKQVKHLINNGNFLKHIPCIFGCLSVTKTSLGHYIISVVYVEQIWEAWLRGERNKMPFAIPRIWREPKNHFDECCFCMVNFPK